MSEDFIFIIHNRNHSESKPYNGTMHGAKGSDLLIFVIDSYLHNPKATLTPRLNMRARTHMNTCMQRTRNHTNKYR